MASTSRRPSRRGDTELIVNARNGSAFPALPARMIVETRCTVDSTGATPAAGPQLPLHQLVWSPRCGPRRNRSSGAVVNRDRDAAVHGFAIHPLIGSWDLAHRLVASVEADEPSVAALFR